MAKLSDAFRVINDLREQGIIEEYAVGGVSCRVMRPEYLAALWLQAGGAKRRERVEILRQSGSLDEDALRVVLHKHGIRG